MQKGRAMGKWVPCGESFIVGDVIRWTEPIWLESAKKEKGQKAVRKVGERRVTAEVLAIDGRDYVSLSVCACEILSNKDGLLLKPFKKKRAHPKKAQHDREGKRRAPEMERRGRAVAGGEQVLRLNAGM